MSGGERRNIEKMAEVLAHPLFVELGWERTGPTNINCSCEEPERHGKGKEHPVDAVFRYKDPYSGADVYLNTDLKSYAGSTLGGVDLKKILKSLGQAVDCANKTKSWRDRYVQSDGDWVAEGLLFIYNHDGKSDRDFPKLMSEMKASDAHLPKGRRIHVLTPERVEYFAVIANDLQKARGATRDKPAELPAPAQCTFYYPDLEEKKVAEAMFCPCATIELLVQRRMVVRYDWGEERNGDKGYIIYDSGTGDSPEYFLYLLDFIFHEKLLRDAKTIAVSLPVADKEAKAHFENAKRRYAETSWTVEETSNKEQFQKRLNLISFRPVTNVNIRFSEVVLGYE